MASLYGSQYILNILLVGRSDNLIESHHEGSLWFGAYYTIVYRLLCSLYIHDISQERLIGQMRIGIYTVRVCVRDMNEYRIRQHLEDDAGRIRWSNEWIHEPDWIKFWIFNNVGPSLRNERIFYELVVIHSSWFVSSNFYHSFATISPVIWAQVPSFLVNCFS